MKEAFNGDTVSQPRAHKHYNRFLKGRESEQDDARSGCSNMFQLVTKPKYMATTLKQRNWNRNVRSSQIWKPFLSFPSTIVGVLRYKFLLRRTVNKFYRGLLNLIEESRENDLICLFNNSCENTTLFGCRNHPILQTCDFFLFPKDKRWNHKQNSTSVSYTGTSVSINV